MSNEDKEAAVNNFLDTVETQGVAASTVKDGHVLMFKTQWLRDILNKNGHKEQISIFIQRPQSN